MWISLWVLTCAHGALRKSPAAAIHAQHPLIKIYTKTMPCVPHDSAWLASTPITNTAGANTLWPGWQSG